MRHIFVRHYEAVFHSMETYEQLRDEVMERKDGAMQDSGRPALPWWYLGREVCDEREGSPYS